MAIKLILLPLSVWAMSEEEARGFVGKRICDLTENVVRRDDREPDTTKHKAGAKLFEFHRPPVDTERESR
mgnify:FL=1